MAEPEKRIECQITGGFGEWMARAGGSLAVTTYQAGKLVLLGWNGRRVSILPRNFRKPMGLAIRESQMALACRDQVVFLANAAMLARHYPERNCGRYDALFLPRAVYHTGELNLHDLAFGSSGLWAVNTTFSCLCNLSDSFNFIPRWKPSFVSELVPEDRCHLNGLALLNGQPKYVTAHARTDSKGAWRLERMSGGIIIDYDTGELALTALSMPHSPRCQDGKLFFLNSGRGEFCVADPAKGTHEIICTLPGYVRGLCFVGRYAVVGLSKIRSSHVFDGMPVQQRFPALRCGVAAVNLDTGENVGMFEFTEGCEELYDVQFLPGVMRPSVLNSANEAARLAISGPDFGFWLQVEEDPAAKKEKHGASETGAAGNK